MAENRDLKKQLEELKTLSAYEYLTETKLSKRAIAKKLGMNAAAVAKYASDHGIDMSNRYKASYYHREPGNKEDASTFYHRRTLEELGKTPVMSCSKRRWLPDWSSRKYGWISASGPPSCFQLVILHS